jgi:COP9 signalosome complex subunit 2
VIGILFLHISSYPTQVDDGCQGFQSTQAIDQTIVPCSAPTNDALKAYTRLLVYTKSTVTRNYAEKTINGILDYVGGGKGGPVEVMVLEKFYQATKTALQEARNEVLCSTRICLRID